jgi:malate dehydrogenase (oxaloacetate-decarboxylating)(NADP+)
VENLDRQVERVMEQLDAKPSDLERYIYLYLIGLSDRNETLFFRTVMSDPARFIPILYDPTVADACLIFCHIYRRARGMYISRDMKGRMAEVLRNWPERDIRFICVFDRRAHPGSRRHWRQRHGDPDRQAAALYGLRRGAT